jgi:hypothetical protein
MANQQTATEPVQPKSARAAWAEGLLEDLFTTALSKFIFREGEEISLEWPPYDGHPAQSVLTRTNGSHYQGYSVWAAGTPKESRAVAEGVLYSNEGGYVLVGQERWVSGKTDWFVVLFSR